MLLGRDRHYSQSDLVLQTGTIGYKERSCAAAGDAIFFKNITVIIIIIYFTNFDIGIM